MHFVSNHMSIGYLVSCAHAFVEHPFGAQSWPRVCRAHCAMNKTNVAPNRRVMRRAVSFNLTEDLTGNTQNPSGSPSLSCPYPQCWPPRYVFWCLVQSTAEAEHKSPDDALAVALKLGEATVQLQLTVGQIKSMTLEGMVQIWKVNSPNDVTFCALL